MERMGRDVEYGQVVGGGREVLEVAEIGRGGGCGAAFGGYQ